MIFDCFPFFNELDLLEIRFHELFDVVDYFVLSEATVTHQNNPKPLYYQENKNRFSAFSSKIIHNVITDASPLYKGDPWNIDHHMHDNCHTRGYFSPDDLVIIGDADQIIRASVLDGLHYTSPLQFELLYSYYFFNCVHTEMKWPRSFLLKAQDIIIPPHDIRYHPNLYKPGFSLVKDAGWHFSYMGGIQRIREKTAAFSDPSCNNPVFMDEQHLLQVINEGRDLYNRTNEGPMAFVPLDNSFPKYILDHKDKFKDSIKEMP